MAQLIAVLLIIFAALFYLIGVGWTLFGGTPPDWLITTTSILGAALATNFGAVLGIDLTQPHANAGNIWQRIFDFFKRLFKNIAGFDKDKLPEFAAGLYFLVMIVGAFTLLFRPSDTGLAHDLFYALLGAAIAVFVHYLKKP